MKKKNMLLTLIIILGFSSLFVFPSVAIEGPDYTETIGAGLKFNISGNLNEGETVRIEYDIISGGNKDLYFYIENSAGDRVIDHGRVYGYGLYHFYVPYNDYFTIVFSNTMSLITSKTVEIKIDIVKTITITSPTSTDTFLTLYNGIAWTSTGDFDYVQIDLYKNGAFLESLGWTDNDGSYAWFITLDEYEDGNYYQIKIIDYYDDSIYDYSEYFTIDCEVDKSITITAPTNIDTFSTGYNYITWTTTGDINYVQIRLYEGNTFLGTIGTYEYNDGSFSWYLNPNRYDGSNYRIRISDDDDDSIYDYSEYFTMEIEQANNGASDVYIQPIFLTILLFIIIPVVAVLTIAGVLIHRRRKRIREDVIPITREIPVKEEPVKPQERKLPRITYCSSCGAETLDRTRAFCSTCGAPIK